MPALAVSAFLSVAGAVHAQDTLVLTVAADKAGQKISRQIFGQFAAHLGRGIYEGVWVGPNSSPPNTRGIRNDVVAALKELHVPTFVGPAAASREYQWRNGVGPAAERPATLNPDWGGVIGGSHPRQVRKKTSSSSKIVNATRSSLRSTSNSTRKHTCIAMSSSNASMRSPQGTTLAAPKIDSVNTFEAPNAVAPKSVTAKQPAA